MFKFVNTPVLHGEKVSSTLKIKRFNLGFKNTSSFLGQLTQKSLEKKGFAQSKLITNWNEIVGWEMSKQSKPVKITFPKSGLGATLTIEIDGAFGPEIDLQRETIKQKVNRVYGYTAIAKIIFRPSPFLGYDDKIKSQIYKETDQKKIVSSKRSMVSKTLQRSIFNLENINNQELKKSLNNLSSNFLKKSLIE